MTVGAAREAAVDWVMGDASQREWFRAAYFAGSTVELPAEAELPARSDVDVMVVTGAAAPQAKPGKFRHGGVLLEVTYLPRERIVAQGDGSDELGFVRRPIVRWLGPRGTVTAAQVLLSGIFGA